MWEVPARWGERKGEREAERQREAGAEEGKQKQKQYGDVGSSAARGCDKQKPKYGRMEEKIDVLMRREGLPRLRAYEVDEGRTSKVGQKMMSREEKGRKSRRLGASAAKGQGRARGIGVGVGDVPRKINGQDVSPM